MNRTSTIRVASRSRAGRGPASGAKVAMFAVAIAVVLGALFYGLNNTTVNQAGTTPPSQTAQTTPANPAAPPGMRDVTPRANTDSRHDHRCCAQPPDAAGAVQHGHEQDHAAGRQRAGQQAVTINIRNDTQRADRPAAFLCSGRAFAPWGELADSGWVELKQRAAGQWARCFFCSRAGTHLYA